MCGFAGEFVFGGGSADLELARRMAAKLTHRGPDEEGSFLSSDGCCAIGFRRLAVIDPVRSRQPMTSTGGDVTVAFNGEIYNFRELREDLERSGAKFRTAGDTEVLVHLYERYGEKMVEHLTGMFAFVIYDAREGSLLLVRDRLGQKPLWYASLPDRIVFASEAKGILGHDGVDRSVDMLAMQHCVSLGYVPGPDSIWRGIRKLLPAHRLGVYQKIGEPVRYWSIDAGSGEEGWSDLVERAREGVSRSVEARLVSDVPLGALLSGGLDSSIVVALMARAAGKSGGIRTFTAGFEESRFDEREYARKVAEHCGTKHTELVVRPAPLEALDEVVRMYDEPFADSSALPMWGICRAAREHVTVALVGDGGDEVFGGYDRYRAVHLGERMSAASYVGVRLGAFLARGFAARDERSWMRRLIRFADALPLPAARQYFSYRALFNSEDLGRLFTEEFISDASWDLEATERWFCELYEQEELPDEVTRAQRHDMLTYLPDDLLVKADIASMATSLELRAPMLDHSLVRFGLSLPVDMKVRGSRGKVILREAFADLLPAEILRRPKQGFGVPLGKWLRNELRETLVETLMDTGGLDWGVFRREAVAGLINDHLVGREDHGHRLWALLVLARWLAKQG